MYEDMPRPFLLLLPPLSGGCSLLHAGGLLLGVLDAIATLTMLLGKFFWAHWPLSLPVQSLYISRSMSGAWFFPEAFESGSASVSPASPQQSPLSLIFSCFYVYKYWTLGWLYVSTQTFALFRAGVYEHMCVCLYLCDPPRGRVQVIVGRLLLGVLTRCTE